MIHGEQDNKKEEVEGKSREQESGLLYVLWYLSVTAGLTHWKEEDTRIFSADFVRFSRRQSYEKQKDFFLQSRRRSFSYPDFIWTIIFWKGENYEPTQISLKSAPAASCLRGAGANKPKEQKGFWEHTLAF